MALTFGFYNSVNHDRKYDAIQMSSIFDGIIQDGIYETIGDAFMVKSTSPEGMRVQVGTGRAWFNHTWTLNDSVMLLDIAQSDVTLARIDAIVLEINSDTAVRTNNIKVVKGTPSTNPQNPTLTNNTTLHQYPLAYVRVNARAESINQGNITNTRGTSACPFVIGVLKIMTIDNLIAQWQYEWNEYLNGRRNQFDVWFQDVKDTLSSDAAGNLLNKINDTNSRIDTLGKAFTETRVLSASGWSNRVYTISGSYPQAYVTATSIQHIQPATSCTAAQLEAWNSAGIVEGTQTAGNSFTIKSLADVPTVDIPVRIIYYGPHVSVTA